jgi:hypothetical protein
MILIEDSRSNSTIETTQYERTLRHSDGARALKALERNLLERVIGHLRKKGLP